MSTYRMTVAYLCLVGIPLVGLVGLLRAGQRLVAPVSIGGTWDVEADFSRLVSTPCTTLMSGKQPLLILTQSGSSIVATLNTVERTTLTGILQDMTLTMGDSSDPATTAAANCAEAVYLDATVNTQVVPRVITGTLGVRCRGCGSVPFRAVRQRQSDNGNH